MTGRLGQQLGNYCLTRLLGEGGFAEVYLGEHPLLETMVAIKVLHTQVTQDDVAQFQQEARLLASLRHPHIIRVLDFGLEGQTPYLVMDCAPNGTLRTRHAKGTRLPVPTVVDYVKQIAEALQYAHDRKIVHRDIKPENMLIGEKNEILLTDFGIAVIAHSSHYQSTKDMAGTIAYMAPEQIEAHPRPASDQYSLGIVVYEWLCGTRPFHGSYTEVAVKHSVAAPPPLRQHLPTLLPDVEYVVLTALAKQPEERFASVRAFATALEQASQDMLPTEQSCPHGTSSPLDIPSASSNSSGLSSNPTAISSSPPSQPVESLVTTQTPGQAQGTVLMEAQEGRDRRDSGLPLSVPLRVPTGPNPPEKTTDKPTVSRRALIIGIASGAVIATVAGSAFLLWQRSLPDQAVKPEPNSDTARLNSNPSNTNGTFQQCSSHLSRAH